MVRGSNQDSWHGRDKTKARAEGELSECQERRGMSGGLES